MGWALRAFPTKPFHDSILSLRSTGSAASHRASPAPTQHQRCSAGVCTNRCLAFGSCLLVKTEIEPPLFPFFLIFLPLSQGGGGRASPAALQHCWCDLAVIKLFLPDILRLISEGDLQSPVSSAVIPGSCVLHLKSQDGAAVGKFPQPQRLSLGGRVTPLWQSPPSVPMVSD